MANLTALICKSAGPGDLGSYPLPQLPGVEVSWEFHPDNFTRSWQNAQTIS
ncbi:hypothetical protein [Okeania sp. SIO2B3]|uniref:hypothetical protein n=1 Tax=Okeania sp. SIO2B3 TaxID=2607784 RepID=UPI0013C10134|nr:hypothetical protein [Okeania sp. SIO2B3]NET42492.1 hypothetical protein [Okeania sp. SIO2B3]